MCVINVENKTAVRRQTRKTAIVREKSIKTSNYCKGTELQTPTSGYV